MANTTAEVTGSLDDVLDLIAAIIQQLSVIREKTEDDADRGAINSQILALSKWWRKIDLLRAGQTDPRIDAAIDSLAVIKDDLKGETQKLKNVAKVIHGVAKAIGIAEKVAGFLIAL